ncbi:MAG: hypothetical protein IJX66_07810 [Lachnospiraceae bacterium]|nr:hypothetical protein [Lachnospiraceae bacterium]
MKTIETILKKEICELERITTQAAKKLQIAPKGFLRIKKKRGGVEYYHKMEDVSNPNGRYLKKSEKSIAKGIAQRDYNSHILKMAEERLCAIKRFIDIYDKTNLSKIYQKTNLYRRVLIDDPIIPDEEYIKQWQAVEYEGKPFAEDGPEFITERGERVRSKSEKIIADKLYSLGIPYRYEYPLVLQGNIKIYPDFTILRMPEREEVYLEHFGMMDDSGYVNNVMIKLNTYQKNEIHLGVNLFITHETSRNPLNTKMLDKLMRKLFCVE